MHDHHSQRQTTASSPNLHPALGVETEANATTCNCALHTCKAGSPRALLAFNRAADMQKRWIPPQNLHLPTCIFSKGQETGLVAGAGTQEPGSLHFISISVSLSNLVHNTSPLQTAVQLPVKEILTSRGSEGSYSPVKIPL